MLGIVRDTGGAHAIHALMLAVELRRAMHTVLTAVNAKSWLRQSRVLMGENDTDYHATWLSVGEPPIEGEARRNRVLGVLLLCKVLNVRIQLIRLDQSTSPFDLIDVLTTVGAHNDPLFKGILLPSTKTLTVQGSYLSVSRLVFACM
jgi:hypothetical protein